MTRDEIRDDILKIQSHSILCELPTSVGKSKVALDFMNSKNINGQILIVIPRLVLIQNWKDEFIKWGYEPYLSKVTFSTYISLPKHALKKFSLVIFDECHHLSERAIDAVQNIKFDYSILLSATVKKTLKQDLKWLFPGIVFYKISMKEAIQEEILPDPKVYLIPLMLKTGQPTEILEINPKAKGKPVEVPFERRFTARKTKHVKFHVRCNQSQYHQDLSSMIDFYKKSYLRTNNQIFYFKWQQKALERLKWLSSLKDGVIKQLLKKLDNVRTLTFCNSIEQTEKLGKYCINSKNVDAIQYLKDFNEGKINHITACQMLNEGINLVNCQCGIFVSINSSETMVIQKIGRILRHQNPMIFIVYYKYTREEELVNKMLENYNQELVTIVQI